MTDYRVKVREIINHATGCEENWTRDDKLVVWLVDDAADEIERLRSDLALLGPVTAGVNVSQCVCCLKECADEWVYCPSCGSRARLPDKTSRVERR